jgi:hypothetical protein
MFAIALIFGGAAWASETRQWRFQALLDGDPIGYHKFELRQDSGGQVLSSEAEFQVKFMFITAYDYQHQATERWNANCLDSLGSVTNDNGDTFEVAGAADDGAFVVESGKQQAILPSCVMSFAYWNPAMLEQSRLLNVQDGRYVDVQIKREATESFRLGSESVRAHRYSLNAEDLDITLWYSEDDYEWLGLESATEKGYTLRYERLDPTAALSQRATLVAQAQQ